MPMNPSLSMTLQEARTPTRRKFKFDPEDKEMLEDLVAAAVNQALQSAQQKAQEEMQKVTGGMLGGMNLPGGMKFPGM